MMTPAMSLVHPSNFARVPSSVLPGQKPPALTGVCDACGKPANQQHLNYGANTCLGCRAFFRRIVQRRLKDKLQCKAGGSAGRIGRCQVAVSKGRCQKCRFTRCLAAGMREECVMTKTEVVGRFGRLGRVARKGSVDAEADRAAYKIGGLPRTLLAKHLSEKAQRQRTFEERRTTYAPDMNSPSMEDLHFSPYAPDIAPVNFASRRGSDTTLYDSDYVSGCSSVPSLSPGIGNDSDIYEWSYGPVQPYRQDGYHEPLDLSLKPKYFYL